MKMYKVIFCGFKNGVNIGTYFEIVEAASQEEAEKHIRDYSTKEIKYEIAHTEVIEK